jgi:hypothetical protein
MGFPTQGQTLGEIPIDILDGEHWRGLLAPATAPVESAPGRRQNRARWLRFIRQRLGERVHFWPFDGWKITPGRSAAEVYPALWSRSFAREGRKWRPARRLQHRARRPEWRLAAFLKPDLTPPEQRLRRWKAGFPGFILAGKEQFCHFGKLWRNSHICGEFLSCRF